MWRISSRLITTACLICIIKLTSVAQTEVPNLIDVNSEAVSNADVVSPGKRHLIICLDGIGFSLIEKMRAENNFKTFQSPGRMISPFPTLTNVSMTEIMETMGAEPANGYEETFFDTERNAIRGNLLDRFRSKRFIKNSFRELFDYHPSALKSGLGYAAPPFSTYLEALSDLIRLRQKFDGSQQPVFFAYLGATDSLAHLGGERLVKSYLRRLDSTLSTLQRKNGERLAITIFSDHGNHFRSYQRAKIQDALRASGFKLSDRVKTDVSVVIPQFGLVGCAVLFTREGNERSIAQALRNVEGVDFASYEKDGTVHIISERGEATIERDKTRYRYRAQQGDPLELVPITRRLSADSQNSSDGFIDDAAWFAVTQEMSRPDAVRRIYEGTVDHVRNRASVIVSFKDGYYSGSRTLDLFAFLQATHGSLGREQSLGFVVSTEGSMPTYLRAGELWAAIGTPQLSKAKPVRNGKTSTVK